jgi:uncharacterized protein (TIGR00251 family)
LNAPVSARLYLKVVPGASRERLAGWLGDAMKVCVTAPAESGKANRAVEKFLCSILELPTGSVRIVAGGSSPRKTAEISGVTAKQLNARIERALA